MYCLVKYADLDLLEEEKTLYINPDCALKILLEYIRHETGVEQEFDLCTDDGELQFVNDYEPETRGTHILIPLTVYFVVIVERTEDGQFSKLTPLISKCTGKRSDMSLKMKKYLNFSKRYSLDSKKSDKQAMKYNISSEPDKDRRRSSKRLQQIM